MCGAVFYLQCANLSGSSVAENSLFVGVLCAQVPAAQASSPTTRPKESRSIQDKRKSVF